jgi:hypothetical protein
VIGYASDEIFRVPLLIDLWKLQMAKKPKTALGTALLVLLLAVGASAYCFLSSPLSPFRYLDDKMSMSDIARQFERARKRLPDNASALILFPLQIGAFKLQQNGLFIPDARDRQRGLATYTAPNGETISLSVTSSAGMDFFGLWWKDNFLTLSCGDLSGLVEAHTEGNFPYRYGRCGGLGFSYDEFKWINNGWVISASISSASSTRENVLSLVSFVNTYPH